MLDMTWAALIKDCWLDDGRHLFSLRQVCILYRKVLEIVSNWWFSCHLLLVLPQSLIVAETVMAGWWW